MYNKNERIKKVIKKTELKNRKKTKPLPVVICLVLYYYFCCRHGADLERSNMCEKYTNNIIFCAEMIYVKQTR